MSPETIALQRTWTALALLYRPTHVDDAVDSLITLYGWDGTFHVLASMEDEPRAAAGLYSMVCGLFLDHAGSDHGPGSSDRG